MNYIAFISLAQYKFKKILFNKRVIAAIMVGILVASVMGYAATLDVDKMADGSFLLDTLIISFFLPILVMFYSASVIREEIEDMSITQVITSSTDRYTAYLAYFTALLSSLIILLYSILTVGFFAFFIPLGLESGAWDILLNMYLLVFIGCLVYSSLFLFVSVVIKRSIYFGLFYAFIWEGFIGSIPGKISEIALKHYIRSIGASRMEFMGFASASGAIYSFQVLTVAFIMFLFLGLLAFSYKEFPG